MIIVPACELTQNIFFTPEFIEDITLPPTRLIEGKFEEFINYVKSVSENMNKDYQLAEYIVTFKVNFERKI